MLNKKFKLYSAFRFSACCTTKTNVTAATNQKERQPKKKPIAAQSQTKHTLKTGENVSLC